MPPVDIRFLRFLPPEFLMENPDLVDLRLSDANNDHQVDQTEAETAVIRNGLLSQMRTPPDLSDPQVQEQLAQLINRIREQQNERDHGRELRQAGERYLENAQAYLNRIRRTEADLTPLYNAPGTAPIMLPHLNELRRIDGDGNRRLDQAEVETYLRQAHERSASAAASGSSPTPAPLAEDLAAQAVAFLSVQAPHILQGLSELDPNTASQADQIPHQLYQFDLSPARGLSDEQTFSNNSLRILSWMRSQMGTETLLTRDRTRELLSEHTLDLLPVVLALAQTREPPQDFIEFCRRFSPHFIVTEAQLESYLRDHQLDFNHIPAELLGQRSLQILNTLAGDDHILNGEDIPRFRRTSLEAFQREHPDHPAPGINEIHALPSLFEQFEETLRRNEFHGRLLGESEYLPIEPESFLSRAAVTLVYTLPTQAGGIVAQTRTAGALSLAYVLADGLHDEERAHASDSLPGIGNMFFSAVTSPLALIEGLGNLAFSPSHSFRSGIWDYQWNREWVRGHADRRHQERVAALNLLRRVVGEHHLASLSEGIDYIQQHEENGAAQAEWLTTELHIPELERIYHIENSREQEEAWMTFCRTLRGGQGIHWHGDLRTLFLSPFETHNGPATISLYERMVGGTPNHMVYQTALAAGRDQVGNGGSLFPAFWFRDWADSEASFDGLWDEVGATSLLIAATYGIGHLFQWLRAPGSLTDMPPETWRNAGSIFTRGRYWVTRGATAFPRFTSSLPPDQWRTSESLTRRGGYHTLRTVGTPFRFLFPRAPLGREADLAIEEGARWASTAERLSSGGFFSRRMAFVFQQMAQMRGARFAADPQASRGAEYLNRMITQIETQSTTSFQNLARRTEQALRLVETDPAEARRLLQAIEREAQGAARLHEVSMIGQMSSGGVPRGLEAAARLDTAAEDILRHAQRLQGSEPRLARALTRSAESIRSWAGRSARGEVANADRLLSTEANLRFHAEEQRRRGMMGMGLIVWAWLYERALSDADRANPEEVTLGMAGIDGMAIEGVRRRSRRTRGSRATYDDFSLRPPPTYREEPVEEAPPPPPPPSE